MGKRLVEGCLKIDLAWIMRLASIRAGQAGSGKINWTVDSNAVGSLRFRLDLREVESARLVLCYTLATRDGDRKPIRQVIALTALPQHLGGLRWWMRCPNSGGRARVLYLPPDGDRFASRKALGLIYRVERLGRFERPFEKLFRAQRRLRGTEGLGTGLERPKGMWRQTFARQLAAFEQHDLACIEQIATRIGKA